MEAMREKLLRRWPMYPGGIGGKGKRSRVYRGVAGSHGVPMHISYVTQNKGLSNNRIVRNVKNLEVNVPYLFVIQVDRKGDFYTRFVKTEGRVEISARHAFLANLSNVSNKVVAGSGEIKVLPSGRVVFNLESGTFMVGLKDWFKSMLSNKLTNTEKNSIFIKNYPAFVKNALKLPNNSSYTKNTLINQVNLPLNEIKRRARNTPGVTIRGFITKPKHKLPNLSYDEWVQEMSMRKTRSKGPVRANMRIRN